MKKFIRQGQSEVTYMNVKTMVTYLGVARSTIYKWVESGFIPHRKLRKHVLFIKREIDIWAMNNGMRECDLPEIPFTLRNNGEVQHRA
jgi:excisionase family DNA binding protein